MTPREKDRLIAVIRKVERMPETFWIPRSVWPRHRGGVSRTLFVANSWQALGTSGRRWTYGLTQQTFNDSTLELDDTPDGIDFQADDTEQFALNLNEFKNTDASSIQGNQGEYPGSGFTATMIPIGGGTGGEPSILTPVEAWPIFNDPEAPLKIWLFNLPNGETVSCD